MAAGRRFAGEPAGAMYGTILVAGQLAVESVIDYSAAAVVGSLLASVVVFWLAHAYTDTLGSVISAGPGKTVSFRTGLRKEWPIVESAIAPAAALLICTGLGANPSTAIVVAVVTADVELVGWAFLAARRAGLTGVHRVVASVVGALLGLALVALKVLIH